MRRRDALDQVGVGTFPAELAGANAPNGLWRRRVALVVASALCLACTIAYARTQVAYRPILHIDGESDPLVFGPDWGSVSQENGTWVVRGPVSIPVNADMVNWQLEFRARWSVPEGAPVQVLALINAQSGPGIAQRASISADPVRVSVNYATRYFVTRGGELLGDPDEAIHLADGEFHTYRLRQEDGTLRVYLDGRWLFEWSDIHFSSARWKSLELGGAAPERPIRLEWLTLSVSQPDGKLAPVPSPEENRRWWLATRAEMNTRIEAQRAKTDFSHHPFYRTRVSEGPDTVGVERPTIFLRFSKQTCAVIECRLGNLVLTGVSLPDLVVVDATGRKLRQRFAKDGRLAVHDSRDRLFLRGRFTPLDAEGRAGDVRIRVVYELRKISGQIFVTYSLVPPGKREQGRPASGTGHQASGIRHLAVEMDGGPASGRLDYFFHSGCWYGGGYYPAEYAWVGSAAGATHRVAPGFYAMWTDGRAGFQLCYAGGALQDLPVDPSSDAAKPLLTRGVEPEPGAVGSPPLLSVATMDGGRVITFTAIRRETDPPFALREPFEVALGLGFFPTRPYVPRTVVGADRNWAAPWQFTGGWTPWTEEVIRRQAEVGVDLNAMNVPMYNQIRGLYAENMRRYTSTWHKYGAVLLQYVEGLGRPVRELVTTGCLDEKTFDRAIREAPAGAFGSSSPFIFGNMKSTEFQDIVLLSNYTAMRDYGFDGVYVDSIFVGSPDGSSRLRGVCEFSERLRLLLDSFDTPKYYLAHAWIEHVPAVQGVADFSYPGEQCMGRNSVIPQAELIFGYDPFLTGETVLALNLRCYNLEDLAIFQQFYALGVASNINYYPWVEKPVLATAYRYRDSFASWNFSNNELENAIRYLTPLTTFRPAGVYAPWMGGLGRALQTDPAADTLLYVGPMGLLATFSGALSGTKSADASLDLSQTKLAGRPVVVFDVVEKALVDFRRDGDRIELGHLSFDLGPRALLIAERPSEPRILWYTHAVRRVLGEHYDDRRRQLTAQLQGVPNTSGVVYALVPSGDILSAELRFAGNGAAQWTMELAGPAS